MSFINRTEAVKIAGLATRKLQEFTSLNRLAIEQYQLLKQKLSAATLKLSSLEAEHSQIEAAVQTCDVRFKSRFGAVFATMQVNYEKYLLFLAGL